MDSDMAQGSGESMKWPQIIQGGMGAAVSDWRLAHAVSSQGQIGVVSGTALDLVLARRLQMGDPGEHLRRALAAFPIPRVSKDIIDRFFIAGGKPAGQPFKGKPIAGHNLSQRLQELLVAANFVEVFLAKENHGGIVGINYLHKIQAPLLPSIYGAMLADVDVIIVGAGVPVEIPKVIDNLVRSEPVEMKLYVRGVTNGQVHKLSFTPETVFQDHPPALRRPLFFPIVSSVTLAGMLVKKCKGQVDGLIIEGPKAGGHNAPPRGRMELSSEHEPVYGPRDMVDLDAIKSLELPFWLAGTYGSPEKLAEACAVGATGIQVGTLFAFCEESGLCQDFKYDAIKNCQDGTHHVFTDPIASPTGFPFKVLSISGTLSDNDEYEKRSRKCDLGYLREAYEQADGTVGWRCPAEDQETYVSHGGNLEETIGRKCLCNGLMANIGMPQVRGENGVELALLTCGDDFSGILDVLGPSRTSYTSADVIDFLLSRNGS